MFEKKKKLPIIQTMEGIRGDKIVLMILMLLISISIVTISSSTSMLAMKHDTTRLAIIEKQVITILSGGAIAAVIYFFFNMKVLKFLSKIAFGICFFLLAVLAFDLEIPGVMEPSHMNEAERIIKVFGQSLHVIEVVKLGMVMYTAWVISAYHAKELKMGGWIRDKLEAWNFRWAWRINPDFLNQVIYIYAPIILTGIFTAGMSLFTAVMVVCICGTMIMIGRVLKVKHMLLFGAGLAVAAVSVVSLNRATDGKMFSHLQSSLNRIDIRYEKKLEAAYGTENFQAVLDKVRQPISAKIAIKEAHLKGKGPGNSTQKYVVPIIYEDYMFAFIVEEYGLIGAFFILILYSSLLARGNIIVRNIKEEFGKMAVVGVVFLISGQAIFHILVNVGLLPISGQTLPLVSHGRFSFWIFSAAFGILLNISKLGKENIERESRMAEPVQTAAADEVKSSMDVLDQL